MGLHRTKTKRPGSPGGEGRLGGSSPAQLDGLYRRHLSFPSLFPNGSPIC